MKTFLSFIIVLLTIGSCRSLKKEATEPEIEKGSLTTIAKKELGEQYATLENATGEYTLVFNKYKAFQALLPNVKFFVYEKSTGSKIYEDDLSAGTAIWKSDYVISTTSTQG